ncbi:MAG: orotate phosphoribosyltransferase [Planctomycetes bacterium]|nr:orotate phosphoribosyltransferase [Planctomycetota bacterium]
MTDLVMDHFRETGALLEGHFRLSSGLHSARYLQCARVLMHPDRAEVLCRMLAEQWQGERPDCVIGPALGAVTLSYELARAFKVPGFFAERQDGSFVLRRGFEVLPGQRVLVAEDVVTTGGSVRELIAVLEAAGAHVLGVACLVHRAEENPFGRPMVALSRQIFETWTETECPRCREGLPAVKPGSRPGAAT